MAIKAWKDSFLLSTSYVFLSLPLPGTQSFSNPEGVHSFAAEPRTSVSGFPCFVCTSLGFKTVAKLLVEHVSSQLRSHRDIVIFVGLRCDQERQSKSFLHYARIELCHSFRSFDLLGTPNHFFNTEAAIARHSHWYWTRAVSSIQPSRRHCLHPARSRRLDGDCKQFPARM